MKTIALINTKGGVGKTTLASNLAAWVALTNRRVAMVDLDPQRSLASWWKRRGQSENPQIFSGAESAADAVEKLQLDGWDFCFLDSPPSALLLIQEAIEAADVVLIPCKAGGHDVDAMRDALRLVHHSGKPYRIVINEVMPRERAQEALRETLTKAGFPVASLDISRRTSFATGANVGKAGFEMNDKEAGNQVEQLWNEVLRLSKGSKR
jgi:chromosome partitioning protein